MQPTTEIVTTFDALPTDARIWVFAKNAPFTDQERASLTDTMDTVMRKWVIKQSEIRGCWELREDRFLVVGADESRIGMDGCSVDAMMSWLKRLELELGLKLTDRITVHYRTADGSIRSVGRGEFAGLAAEGAVTRDTRVFDTAVSRVTSLRESRFELPARDSWHAQLFPSA